MPRTLSRLLGFGLIAAGAAASIKTLTRRDKWEHTNARAFIVLDYDDALAVCTRAGISFADFLALAGGHGATHLSLPELTLNRLMAEGRIVRSPDDRRGERGERDNWLRLSSSNPYLLSHLATELFARVPTSEAHLLPSTLAALAGERSLLSSETSSQTDEKGLRVNEQLKRKRAPVAGTRRKRYNRS